MSKIRKIGRALTIAVGFSVAAVGAVAWLASPGRAADCSAAGAWDYAACPAWASLPPPEYPREILEPLPEPPICPVGLSASGEYVPVCARRLFDSARPAPRPEPRKPPAPDKADKPAPKG